MSSTTESLKQPAEDVDKEEPDSKRPKLSDNDTKGDINSVTTANEKNNADSNNKGSSSKTNSNAPTKSNLNGNDKESSQPVDGDGRADDFGAESGNLDGVFDPKIAKALEHVENIQLEICNLNEKASEEILKVEQKFNKLRRPHFEKRNELLKEIPNFWLTSLANHPAIAPMIESAEDEDCLHYMVNLDVEEFDDIKSGYKLKLHFDENPYIENETIVKEFHIISSEEVLSSSTPIEYKNTNQGKNLKKVVENSIANNRRSRVAGLLNKSFFAWLVQPLESGTDEIAEILKDQIWPNPLEFFFATPEDYGAGTDDDSDDDDEEIDDEEIDDEEGVITSGIDYSDEELEGEDDEEDGPE